MRDAGGGYRVTGPLEMISDVIPGAMDDDPRVAVERALECNREEVRERAELFVGESHTDFPGSGGVEGRVVPGLSAKTHHELTRGWRARRIKITAAMAAVVAPMRNTSR